MYGKLSELYSKDAGLFAKVHADDDPDHVEEAVKQIESCGPAERTFIVANSSQTCDMYRPMLEEIARHQ